MFSFLGMDSDRDDIAETRCMLCDKRITKVREYQLVVVGPTDDEDREKHEAGRWYSAGAIICHWTCVDAHSDEDLDALVRSLKVMESESPDPQ